MLPRKTLAKLKMFDSSISPSGLLERLVMSGLSGIKIELLKNWFNTMKGYNISTRGSEGPAVLTGYPGDNIVPPTHTSPPALPPSPDQNIQSVQAVGTGKERELGGFGTFITQGFTLGLNVSPRWGDFPSFSPLCHITKS